MQHKSSSVRSALVFAAPALLVVAFSCTSEKVTRDSGGTGSAGDSGAAGLGGAGGGTAGVAGMGAAFPTELACSDGSKVPRDVGCTPKSVTFDPGVLSNAQITTIGPSPQGLGPVGLETLDVDSDGAPDILVNCEAVGTPKDVLLLWRNIGGGKFALGAEYLGAIGHSVFAIAVGDVDRDGIADVVVQREGGIGWLQGTGKDLAIRDEIVKVPNAGTRFALIDADRDGWPDAVLGRNPAGLLVVRNEKGAFAPASELALDGVLVKWLGVGRRKGSPAQDLFAVGSGSVTVFPTSDKGLGASTISSPLGADYESEDPMLGDVTGDGVDDVVVRNANKPMIRIWDGQALAELKLSGGSVTVTRVRDLNGDTWEDILIVMGDDEYVLLNRGNATFDLAPLFPPSNVGGRTLVLDVNGDGLVDIVRARSGCGLSVSLQKKP